MSANKSHTSRYNIQYTSTKKQRNSPSSSILKTPTPIFLTTRNSSVRTKRLKFANGADAGELLTDFREGSHDSASTTSTVELSDLDRVNYENFVNERKLVEVALSPVQKMKVSPDSWKAFLEYQKYKDHSNETEKTDYTYSRLSKFRNKEIIPGFRIRPNLSRKPIRTGGTYESYSGSWSPEGSFCIERRTYETTSGSAGKLDGGEREVNRQYQNETSEFGTRYDGYSNDETMRFDDKYQSYSTFGDDGRILRSRKGFGYGSSKIEKQSHLGSEWGWDETDDEYITSTNGDDKPSWFAAGGKRIVAFWAAIYTTIITGVASTVTLFKDLFSKYILRRKTGESPYRYSYDGNSWKSWQERNAYSYGKYCTHNQGRLSNWWYQSFLYALYSKMVSAITSSKDYVRWKYNRSSRKGKFLWFLIPLLLLLGLWLMRAEGEDAFVSNKVTAFKCKVHQYLTPVRHQVRGLWGKVSDFGERIFGRSLEPLRYFFRFLAAASASAFDWTIAVLATALTAILNVLDVLGGVIGHFCSVFAGFVSDAVSKKDSVSSAVYDFFSGIVLTVLQGLSLVGGLFLHVWRYLESFFVARPTSDVKMESVRLDYPGQDLTSHWDELRLRIEALEMELRKVKEEKNAGALLYQKKLDDNYKALQKYQIIVKEALRRQSSKPVQLSQTSIHSVLDNATDELKKWILAHFMLKTETTNEIDEKKFALLMEKYSNKSGEDLKMLQDEFSRFVRQYSAEITSLKTDINIAQYQELNGNDMSLSLVKKIVADEIKLHDADKTGKVDFALQSAGGQVLSVKCTKSLNHCFKYNNIFGVQVCAQMRRNAPEEAINPGMAPGQCWAFVGSQGFLTLELSHTIVVTGFTMEHISRLLSPNGKIESAPRKFSMWGLKSEFDMDPYQFGEYEYKDNNETYQYFPVANYTAEPFKVVELSIASNHGNPNYTCLYRIRVHGDIYPSHV